MSGDASDEDALDALKGLDIADAADEAFKATLDDAQSYQHLQTQLHTQLKAGWLSLSRAKYAMGPSAVSQMQYDDEPRAGTTLRTAGTPDGGMQLLVSDEAPSRPPLRWFGGMVSPHLRSAQTAFMEALQTAVQLATTASRIRGCTAPPRRSQSTADAPSDDESATAE